MDDLFGSDEDEEEDPEVVKEREARLAEYKKKKEAKAKPAAKSLVTLEVKPWGKLNFFLSQRLRTDANFYLADDETDLVQMEKNVRAIEKDGLVWGASKLVAVGFGIKKLQINLVVEDEKVSTDELQQQIEEDEDHVQSTDIVRLPALYCLEMWVCTDFWNRLLCKNCKRDKRDMLNDMKNKMMNTEIMSSRIAEISCPFPDLLFLC